MASPRTRGADSAKAVRRLARLAGIASSYRDTWGRRRRAPLSTLRALLRTMGFAVDDPAATADSLRALDLRHWRRPLEPVAVARAGGRPIAVSVVLEGAPEGDALAWRLDGEAGTLLRGEARAGDLTALESREVDGVARTRCRLALPAIRDPGYYRLTVEGSGFAPDGEVATLIAAPGRCHLPRAFLREGKSWGFAAQAYGLRSAHDWGMGDFSDLAELAEGAARLGAGAMGVNPLHALFPARPEHASPYGPSSRTFLNVLYLDVEAVPEFESCGPARALVESPEFRDALGRLRESRLVDYPGVTARKLEVLELLYAAFRDRHLGGGAGGRETGRGHAFRAFQVEWGSALERQALFEALSEHFRREGAATWRDWPAPYRDASSPEVLRFAAEHADRLRFYAYLQWLADDQLAAAARRARESGMAVGLYRDLAVGADSTGAEAWAAPELFATGATVGAPPDPFNLSGQNWGLPPMSPVALREQAYAPFVTLLRANMRHAGALRVDHVMGWMRLFWIPEGASPEAGAYVRYPFDDLLGIAALESRRNRCLLIGEDLGTVPRGLRRRMARANVLSYRLFYFERHGDGRFAPPERYPRLSLASVSTHDLPTLPGYWAGHDLEVRARLGLFPSPEAEREARAERARDRRLILDALAREGLIGRDLAAAQAESVELSGPVAEAVHAYLARAPACLVMVHFEDALGEVEQVNLPGTSDQHPNWRRKQPLEVAAALADPRVRRVAAIMRRLRTPAADRGGGAP